MITCGYYSETKRETCVLPKGHDTRHFKYEDADGSGPFSIKGHNKITAAQPRKRFKMPNYWKHSRIFA